MLTEKLILNEIFSNFDLRGGCTLTPNHLATRLHGNIRVGFNAIAVGCGPARQQIRIFRERRIFHQFMML